MPIYCPVLGIKLVPGGQIKDHSPSLDRIDNTKGYVKGNVHVISDRANRLKSDGTPEELMKVALYFQR